MKKHKLEITELADQDLDDLYAEGFALWGEEQADRYYDGLLRRFDRICEIPIMYTAVDDIRPGYRRSVYEKHSIYFAIVDDTVEIHAVIKRQDLSGII